MSLEFLPNTAPLRTPEEVTFGHCPSCGGPGLESVSNACDLENPESPARFSLRYCDPCGIGFSEPPLDTQALASYYPDQYEAYVPKTGFAAVLQKWKYSSDLRLVKKQAHGAAATLYEVGAGRGEFLAQARKAGYLVSGLEPSPHGRQAALTHWGMVLDAGYLGETQLPRGNTVIVARHVLEHTGNPCAALHSLWDGLKPGGQLLLKVPLLDGWEFRQFGKLWGDLDLPRHRCHFTGRGIRELLRKLGFVDITVRRELVPASLARSIGFLERFDSRLSVRRSAALFSRVPWLMQLTLCQFVVLLLSPWGAGRAVIHARRPA